MSRSRCAWCGNRISQFEIAEHQPECRWRRLGRITNWARAASESRERSGIPSFADPPFAVAPDKPQGSVV
jgi:hypothetical protein